MLSCVKEAVRQQQSMHCWGRAESWAGERGTSLHLLNPLQADMLGHCHHTRWCPIWITLIVIFLQDKAVIAWGIVISWKRGSVWDLENITQSIWGSFYITRKSKQLLTLRWLQATSSQDASRMQLCKCILIQIPRPSTNPMQGIDTFPFIWHGS